MKNKSFTHRIYFLICIRFKFKLTDLIIFGRYSNLQTQEPPPLASATDRSFVLRRKESLFRLRFMFEHANRLHISFYSFFYFSGGYNRTMGAQEDVCSLLTEVILMTRLVGTNGRTGRTILDEYPIADFPRHGQSVTACARVVFGFCGPPQRVEKMKRQNGRKK